MFRLLKLDIIRENAVPVEGTIDWDEAPATGTLFYLHSTVLVQSKKKCVVVTRI